MDSSLSPPFNPLKRKRPGGQRQRLARAADLEKKEEAKSHLAEELLLQWSWGAMSPQTVQKLSMLAAKDFEELGHQPPQSGKNPQHIHKQLLAHCNESCHLHQPHLFYTPLKDYTKKVLQQCMMPHQLFSDIYHFYPDAWVASFVPQHADIAHFWKLQKSHCQWPGHPLAKRSDVQYCAPLSLHGDGTPALGVGKIWSKQLTIFSFCSMLSQGSTKNTLFHIWNVFDATTIDETWDHFFAELCWSFEWLFKGKFPHQNAQGHL